MQNIIYVTLSSIMMLTIVWMYFTVVLNIDLNVDMKFTFVLYVLIISGIAFTYEPTIYTDLYRLFQTLDAMRLYNLEFYNTYEYITSFFFYITTLSKTNSLLPLMITFIRYSIFFYCVFLFVKKFNINIRYLKIYLIVFFAFFPIIESISGIRYYFAVTIFFGILIIQNFIYSSKLLKLGFLLPVFVHSSSVMFIVIKIFSAIKNKKISFFIKVILLTWFMWQEQILYLLNNFSNPFILYLTNSLTNYLTEDREISINLTIARIILLICIILIYKSLKRKDVELFSKYNLYFNFISMYLYFTLGSVFNSVFFQRNIFFLAVCTMPLILLFLNSKSINTGYKAVISFILLCLSFLMYLNQLYGFINGYF